MGDSYKFNQEGVLQSINSIKQIIESYANNVSELNRLVRTIESSSGWKDVNVKTSFIETCESYVILYRGLISRMNKYVKYLSDKAGGAAQIEQAFMR